ncbi:hypothetical protein TNCV_2087561 [Trichonephila clavipes]|nr:hypothetical protein TNCV_2087561 [Trichonephila clavipes]
MTTKKRQFRYYASIMPTLYEVTPKAGQVRYCKPIESLSSTMMPGATVHALFIVRGWNGIAGFDLASIFLYIRRIFQHGPYFLIRPLHSGELVIQRFPEIPLLNVFRQAKYAIHTNPSIFVRFEYRKTNI